MHHLSIVVAICHLQHGFFLLLTESDHWIQQMSGGPARGHVRARSGGLSSDLKLAPPSLSSEPMSPRTPGMYVWRTAPTTTTTHITITDIPSGGG
jgi:hypothetical protein